jgi:hypothetical protein
MNPSVLLVLKTVKNSKAIEEASSAVASKSTLSKANRASNSQL